MTQVPLVSVAIPAYNAADFVGSAIESALGQSHPAIEVVVANDGSTDDTAAVLASFGSQITVLDLPNGGPAAARNQAIQAASGELVALLDADDYWEPHRIARCVDRLGEISDADFVTTDHWLETLDGRRHLSRYVQMAKRGRAWPLDQVRGIAESNFVWVGTVAPKSHYDRYGYFDESLRSAEDWDIWIRWILGGARAVLIDEPLGTKRLRPDSLSTQDGMLQARLKVLDRHREALWADGPAGDAFNLWKLARLHAGAGNRRLAWRYVRATSALTGRSAGHRLAVLVRGLVFCALGKVGHNSADFEPLGPVVGPTPVRARKRR